MHCASTSGRRPLVGALMLTMTMSLALAGCSDEQPAGSATPTVEADDTTSSAPTATDDSSGTATTSEPAEPAARSATQEPAPSTAAASASEAPATATTSSPSGTAAPSPTGAAELPTTPEAYADAFIRAWGAGNWAVAERYALQSTLEQIDLGRPGGLGWARESSGPHEEGTYQAAYRDTDGSLVFLTVDRSIVERGLEDGIIGAAFNPPQEDDVPPDSAGLPTTVAEYADAFVRAWGVGDPASADAYADQGGMALFEIELTGGTDWTRTSIEGSNVTYTDGDGDQLVVTVDPSLVAAGARNGVISARLG